VQANVGSHCLECAKAERPTVSTRARYWNARQPTLVTYALMAINIAVFAVITIGDPDSLGRGRVSGELGDGKLGQIDVTLHEFFLRNGEWYRMVTSGFLHYGIIHLAFNMLLLFQLGQLLEPLMGRLRFGLLYFAALLAGSAGAMLLQPDGFHGGASGAVFGLMGAAAVAMRQRGINPLTTGLGTTLILNLVITLSIPGISIGGHLGGIIGGAAVAWFALPPRRGPVPVVAYVAPVAVIVVSLAATWLSIR
jgi:membrane associated rhomboid family serine protease